MFKSCVWSSVGVGVFARKQPQAASSGGGCMLLRGRSIQHVFVMFNIQGLLWSRVVFSRQADLYGRT